MALNNEVMSELNYQVDELGKSPERVAEEFLETLPENYFQ